jgi:alpha-galactosidase/6-phospho-beta-glucosidase family protein
VRIIAAGNNHNIFCDEVQVGGTIYPQENLDDLAPRVFDSPFREAIYRRYGVLVGNFSRHPIEFFPGFLTPESGFGRSWGVEPIAGEIDPLKGARQDRSRAVLETALVQRGPIAWREERTFHGLALDTAGRAETGHSREIIDDFIAALAYGGDLDIHLNLPNEGAIAGVTDASNVEVPVQVRNGHLARRPVRFNPTITAEIQRVAQEQHLIARACVGGSDELLVEALTLDALVPDRDIAARLVREMRAFEADVIEPWRPDE